MNNIESGKKPSLTLNTLKYIAIVAMTIDHLAWAFVPDDTPLAILMHCIGNITGPIMFYAAVEGYHHTRNINRYTFRLVVFALISYFPFIYFSADGVLANLNFAKPNVIFTILLGILAIRVFRELKYIVLKIPLIILLIFLATPSDWGINGLFIIIIFDFFYGSFKNQAFGYSLLVFFNFNFLSVITLPFFQIFFKGGYTYTSGSLNYYLENVGLFIPILLLSFYKGEKGKSTKISKWFFYIFYPAHLLLLGFIKHLTLS